MSLAGVPVQKNLNFFFKSHPSTHTVRRPVVETAILAPEPKWHQLGSQFITNEVKIRLSCLSFPGWRRHKQHTIFPGFSSQEQGMLGF
ncbi:hypothetical protein MHYP_G00013680 [Metynnis hypsauchen]